MKFENASIKNLESVEEYVEKLMLSGKIFQREYVEEHIFIGLQRSGQEEIERQNTEFDGIEKYLYIRINTEGGAFITAKVNQSYWEKAEVSVQEAWSLAKKNTNKESFVMGLAEYIAKKYGKDMATMLFPNKTPFYVVTNKSEYKGASAILNKKMLSEFGRKYNINKVVVIPSSIHEMLILSADILELERMEELTKMVQDVNANEVLVREQLSDRAYILDICDGISIHLPETKMENEKVQSVFGVIYMDTLEEMKEMENLSFEQVVERIIEVVWKNSPKLNDFPKNDKEVLQKITIGFQRTEYNSNMLKRKSDFDGIEEYLYIMTEDGKININDDFLKYFNVPVESAWRAAEENTKRDSIIFSMADFFKDVADVKNFIKIPLYVVTNKEMKYSASAIINKERLSDYCHEIDINKIVVIPSSIHEMLFLPWDEEIDERYMDEMIQEVNDTLVSPIEQLGNKSYIMEV